MSFKRARSDIQIKTRIEEIIKVAAQIYDEHGYEGVNFSTISELTKFTRPTIYKYFSTKEEILLQILSYDLDNWVSTLLSSFQYNKIYTTEEISKIWAHSIASQKRMNELYSILFTMLEKNASMDAIIEFKRSMFESVQPLVDLIRQLFPSANLIQIQYFMTIQHALAVGYYPMCNLTDIQIEAMQTISPNYIFPDFETGFQKALHQLMLLLENQSASN